MTAPFDSRATEYTPDNKDRAPIYFRHESNTICYLRQRLSLHTQPTSLTTRLLPTQNRAAQTVTP